MKNTLIILFAILILAAAGCTKKTSNETAGDKNTEGKIETAEYKCPGMHCSGCEETIAEEVKKVDGVKEIKADANEKYVRVVFYAGKTSKEDISKAISSAGYDNELITP